MMAERYGRQRGQQLEGMIRIRVQPKGKHIVRLVRQWCDAARRELVRVAKRQKKGRGDELVLFTDKMTMHLHPDGAGSLVAHYINDQPANVETERFDSYLGRGTIVLDTDATVSYT
jgi:hypothetical protein